MALASSREYTIGLLHDHLPVSQSHLCHHLLNTSPCSLSLRHPRSPPNRSPHVYFLSFEPDSMCRLEGASPRRTSDGASALGKVCHGFSVVGIHLSQYNRNPVRRPCRFRAAPHLPGSSPPSVLAVVGFSQKTCFIWFLQDALTRFYYFLRLGMNCQH